MDFFGYVFPVHVGNPKIYVVNPSFFWPYPRKNRSETRSTTADFKGLVK